LFSRCCIFLHLFIKCCLKAFAAQKHSAFFLCCCSLMLPACSCRLSSSEPVFLAVFISKKEVIGVLVSILVCSCSGLISVYYWLVFLFPSQVFVKFE
jgi:hypothetical protein